VKRVITKTVFLLVLLATGATTTQAQLSSRSRIGDLFGIPMRPYAGLQMGILSFYGDVKRSTGHHWLTGLPAGKFDFMLEIGSEGMFSGNLSFMYGKFRKGQTYPYNKVQVPQTSAQAAEPELQYTDLAYYEEGNLNFKTNFFSIGLQGEYRIKNIPGMRNVYPYISTGINILIFNPYADRYFNKEITKVPTLYEEERLGGLNSPVPAYDRLYETQLKTANIYGQGTFSTVSVGFPLDMGFDFKVQTGVNIRIGTSFTFTLTDYIDGVSSKVARAATFDPEQDYTAPVNRASRLQTNNRNDFYAYTYVACYVYLPFL
jgi:hypothetical protein